MTRHWSLTARDYSISPNFDEINMLCMPMALDRTHKQGFFHANVGVYAFDFGVIDPGSL
jgi:hypothetical protein